MKKPTVRPQPSSAPQELRRVLGVWDAAALIVGIIIGSGIFATPPLVAEHLPSTGGILAVWTLGGVLALCGALCYAELTAMFPLTGGAYIFLREGYGRFPAFAYGWSALLVTYPASIAGVAVVFTAYLSRLVPLPDSYRPWVAAGVCLGLAMINVFGVRLGAWTLRIFTGAKVLALASIVAVAFASGRGSLDQMDPMWAPPSGDSALAAVALALVAVLWTYEGWADGPTLAGEVRDRNRDVVRALLYGTIGVTVVYLLTNLAYVFVLGVDGVRGTDSVAVDVADRLFGGGGAVFVTVLVLFSTLGAMLGMIIGASRIFFALGRDRLFFAQVGRVHPRWGTPATALAGVGGISAVYALMGSFESIIRYFVFVATIWFALNIASVILHRRRRPQADRPFRVPLYPLPPIVFLGGAFGLLIQLFLEQRREALVGLLVLTGSIPAYLLWERWRASGNTR